MTGTDLKTRFVSVAFLLPVPEPVSIHGVRSHCRIVHHVPEGIYVPRLELGITRRPSYQKLSWRHLLLFPAVLFTTHSFYPKETNSGVELAK